MGNVIKRHKKKTLSIIIIASICISFLMFIGSEVVSAGPGDVAIGEVGNIDIANGTWHNISFQNGPYDSVPVVIATVTTNNQGCGECDTCINGAPTDIACSPPIPTINYVGTDCFNITIYYDNGTASAETFDWTNKNDTVCYWVINTSAISSVDWIDAGVYENCPDGGVDVTVNFNKVLSGPPAVFLTPQTYRQDGNVSAHYWEDGEASSTSCNILGGTHQGTGDSMDSDTPHEDVGWLAIDLDDCEIYGFESGSANIANSAWTAFSHTATEPIVVACQNDDDGGQDPQYVWVRDLYDTPQFHYCESDAGGYCNSHTDEVVYWACIDADDDGGNMTIPMPLATSVDTISPYEQTTFPLQINATSTGGSPDNVTLYYRWSEVNNTFSSSYMPNTGVYYGTSSEGGETNLNQYNTFKKLEWNTQIQDGSSVMLNVSDTDYITVQKDGDYLIKYTLPLLSTYSAGSRTCVESVVYVNDVKQDVGRAASTYIRNDGYGALDHKESSAHLNVLLEDLTVGDQINIRVKASSNKYGSSYSVIADDRFTMYIERIEDSETIFTATATETTAGTDMAPASETGIKWVESIEDTGYTHDDVTNPDRITLDNAGTYLVYFNVPLGGAVTRGNVLGRVYINTTMVDGGLCSQGYIRNDDAHYDSSIHWGGIITTDTANQYLRITVQTDLGDETITVDSEKATLYIQNISTDGVIKLNTTQIDASDNWDVASRTAIDWDGQEMIDTDVYFHGTGNTNITLKESGNYLLICNGAFSYNGGQYRPNPKITVEVDGVVINGAESKSCYIRDNNEQIQASDLLVFPLTDLSSGEDIEIYIEQESAAITDANVNDETPVTVTLMQLPSLSLNATNWRVWEDATNPDTSSPWSWQFDFPNSTGYYEFYSIAQKALVDTELTPDTADAICFYNVSAEVWNSSSAIAWKVVNLTGKTILNLSIDGNMSIAGVFYESSSEPANLAFNITNLFWLTVSGDLHINGTLSAVASPIWKIENITNDDILKLSNSGDLEIIGSIYEGI